MSSFISCTETVQLPYGIMELDQYWFGCRQPIAWTNADFLSIGDPGPFLLTWINFNPNMDE